MNSATFPICRRPFVTVLLAGLISAALSSQSHAAGGVSCASKDGKAELSIAMGRLPIYAPTNASARLGDKRWEGTPQNGELQLGESQGLIEANRFSADFTGANIMKIIISLRIDLTKEETEDGTPGTLTFEDGIARKVFCQFE